MYCGAEAEWTIGSCKPISKMPEGIAFSCVEEKDRARLTRTSDTLCMIEGDSDDERKTRVPLIAGSSKTLMSTMPPDVGTAACTTGHSHKHLFK